MTREEILKVAKPILFNTDMVRAILAEQSPKTQTRRIAQPDEHHKYYCGRVPDYNLKHGGERIFSVDAMGSGIAYIKPRYREGALLYVRETWRVGAWDIHKQLMAFDYKDGTCGEMVYIHDRDMFLRLVDQAREDARKAGCEYNGVDFVWEKGKSPCRWHPSIHMPKETARIFLSVNQLRLEKLQDITLEDAFNEGIMFYKGWESEKYIKERKEAIKNGTKPPIGYAPLERFIHLWNSTISREKINIFGWDANPWVWVYEFKKAEVEG